MNTTERKDLINIMSDMHKDAYGFRPRHINYSLFTNAELEAECDHYQEVIKEDLKRREIQLEADLKAWDDLIDKTIHLGAGDYKTALRWIVDGANEWDAESIVWSQGILFSDKGRALVKEINEVCNDILKKVYEGCI